MYYFTFGDAQLFTGGWVEVEAAGYNEAREKFAEHYGDRAFNGQYLRFAFQYDEEQFAKTGMKETGNLGYFCHESI